MRSTSLFLMVIMSAFSISLASAGNLFNITSYGTSIAITTSTTHNYTGAGIKLHTSSYTLDDVRSNCSKISNSYCSFSVSKELPKILYITGPTGTGKITLCLNALGPISCEKYSVQLSAIPIPVIYIINGFGSGELGNNTVAKCSLASNGTLTSCSNYELFFDGPVDITINPKRTYLYITNSFNGTVSKCNLNAQGDLISCSDSTSLFSRPFAIVFNPAATLVYIANYDANTISKCIINSSGDFSSCVSSGFNTSGPTGIVINSRGTYAYVSNYLADNISKCPIDSHGDLINCITSGTGMNNPSDIALNNSGTTAYVTNYGGNDISSCSIDQNGDLQGCFITAVGFNSPQKIILSADNTKAYITNSLENKVSVCSITGNTLTDCTTSGDGFHWPLGMVLITS